MRLIAIRPGDITVVIWEALQAFILARRKTAQLAVVPDVGFGEAAAVYRHQRVSQVAAQFHLLAVRWPYTEGYCSRARVSRKARIASGIVRPASLLWAMIVRADFGLKENRDRGLSSKMADKEETSAALGNSEVLRVQDAVAPLIPELPHLPEDGSKIPSAVACKNTGHVLPEQPGRPQTGGGCKEGEGEPAALVLQSPSSADEGESLTGGSSHENINCTVGSGAGLEIMSSDVSKIGHCRPAGAKDGSAVRVVLRKPGWSHPERFPGDGCRFYTGAHGAVSHRVKPHTFICGTGSWPGIRWRGSCPRSHP